MTERRPLGEVSHTNPYTGESFGETQTYARGRVIAADGGERSEDEAADPDPDPDPDQADAATDDTTLKTVDHTRDGAPSANAAYDRDDDVNTEDVEADDE